MTYRYGRNPEPDARYKQMEDEREPMEACKKQVGLVWIVAWDDLVTD